MKYTTKQIVVNNNLFCWEKDCKLTDDFCFQVRDGGAGGIGDDFPDAFHTGILLFK